MSKHVKAIDLVWKALPMVEALHKIMASMAAQKPGKSAEGTLADDCENWLDTARGMLHLKGAR